MGSGRHHRAARRAHAALVENDRRDAERAVAERSVAAARRRVESNELRRVQTETAQERYPFSEYVGHRSEWDLQPKRLHGGGHPRSDSALRLLADGQLVILKTRPAWKGVSKPVWLVTGPTDAALKVLAFEAGFARMLETWHGDGRDFVNMFAPGAHWTWDKRMADDAGGFRQNYWSALSDGVIFTLEEEVARQVRKAYIELCRAFMPELYAKANHCTACGSSDLVPRYDDGDLPRHDILITTCRDCGHQEML